MARLAAMFLFVLVLACQGLAGTLERIEKSGTVRVGFREGAIPFAFLDPETGTHRGFSVDMADILARNLSARFEKTITVTPVSVSPDERIASVIDGRVDVEMGSTTYTQQREDVVDFSIIFFVSETTFLVSADSSIRFVGDLSGKRVGGAKGTTNLESVRRLAAAGEIIPAAIVSLTDHTAGMRALEKGDIDAYVTDRSLLAGIRSRNKHPERWSIMDGAIAYDPYAYIVPEADSDFRDFLNNTIRWAIITGEFYHVYDKWMGPDGHTPIRMSPSLRSYLNVVAYPMDEDWYLSGKSEK